MNEHLTIIDLGAVFYAAWHAVPPSEPAGKPHDVTAHRIREIAREAGGHVAIAADSPRNWRHDLYPEYKANRESKGSACIAQLIRVIETLRIDGFEVWSVLGFEADDIIAAVAAQCRRDGVRLTIATDDKDLHQLVGATTAVYSLRKDADVGVAEVRAAYGIDPPLIADWLALVGDKADNVPGVPSIGAKTATALLQEWGSLASLMVAAESGDERLDVKMAAKLLAAKEQVSLSAQLVALRTDVPGVDYRAAMRERVASPLPGTEAVTEADFEEEAPAEPEPRRVESVATTPRKVEAPEPAALALRPGSDEWCMALEPSNSGNAMKLAAILHNSRLFGQFANAEAVLAVIAFGRTLGVPATTALRSVHVIEGKLTLSAQFIVGLVLKSGKADYLKCTERTAERATWRTHRKGDPDPEPTVCTWTIEDAAVAGLAGKGNWKKHPAAMLAWRAGTDICRLVYPDVVGSLYTPDELDETGRMAA